MGPLVPSGPSEGAGAVPGSLAPAWAQDALGDLQVWSWLGKSRSRAALALSAQGDSGNRHPASTEKAAPG